MDENPQITPITSEPVAPTPVATAPNLPQPAKPAPKIPKNQLILIISLAVLALAGVCFGVYGIIKANNNNPAPTPAPSTPSDNTPVTTTKTTDEKVRDIIDKISSKIESETALDTTVSTENGSALIGIDGTSVYTNPNKAYGITIDQDGYQKESEILAAANSVFTANGYNFVKEKLYPGASESIYYNATDGIYCNISYALAYCSSEDWIDEDDKELVVALSKATSGEDTITASVDNIKNSPIAPYQKITAGITSAAGLFYRVSPDSDWVFFKGTQAVLPCSDYTGDAAKAFAGEQCESANGLSTVQP